MTTPVVLDAAAGVEFLLDTAADASLRSALPGDAVEWVPELYYAEVAAVLRRAELAGRIPPARVAAAFSRLVSSPLRRVQVKPLLRDAWQLRHNVTVTDAVYVVLARHLGASLVTADLKLARVPGLGVNTITP